MIQNICLLPNKHLLVEGGLMEQIIEVWELEEDSGILLEPVHIIQTGARGFAASVVTDDVIYMGFTGTLTDMNLLIQVYDYNYEM